MKTIEQVWKENNTQVGLKVRWTDWGFRHRYFEIQGEDGTGKKLIGELDNGEVISYLKTSAHWKVYQVGDEEVAKAV